MSAAPARFADFGPWLKSSEYAAELAKLKGAPAVASRDDFPVDVSHLIRMHREIGTQQIHWAVEHFNAADQLEATP
jgi:hypothetical protein